MKIPDAVEPRIIERECGGWLATSPKGALIRLGETGATKDDAVERFRLAWRQWRETLEASDSVQTRAC